MALQTQCKGFAEEGSGGINVLQIVLNVALKAGPRKVGPFGTIDAGMIRLSAEMKDDRVELAGEPVVLENILAKQKRLVIVQLYGGRTTRASTSLQWLAGTPDLAQIFLGEGAGSRSDPPSKGSQPKRELSISVGHSAAVQKALQDLM
ncbi:hypothetical protein DEU56DRAFT_753389 [Suillus clintonianus]|uniref:uncharacterized protein n=1 Tax=Suillus clintonianus TaxID=1904413 RepID=UPI001B86E518|nr:uncharacterized protein DEU56DRAFT_753389 [Suillus clintonianus]KAG2147534.1 hypothetical protein DEU56DRAFT_753389 [Suillus clintonianus]